MAVHDELPKKINSRAGAGWWMDGSGAWRPPQEWPEDSPPFDGWTRGEDGLWTAPIEESPALVEPKRTVTAAKAQAATGEPRISLQARADRRAMLTVVGALVGAALLLVVALILITQAGASGTGEAQSAQSDEPEIIYAPQDDEAELAQRRQIALEAPGIAVEELAELEVRDEATDVDFDAATWTASATDCLDISERVLLSRSAIEVTWADQLECVLDRGSWTARYLRTGIDSVVDAEVLALVPAEVAHASGGSEWTIDTRSTYMADTRHPASLHIVARDSGHNPRNQTPDQWRPGDRGVWCAYAVDWVTVKARWELSVTAQEAEALEMMLATCSDVDSNGANPDITTVETIEGPAIRRLQDR